MHLFPKQTRHVIIIMMCCCLVTTTLFAQNGSLDIGFANNGIARIDIDSANDYGFEIAVQSDGKILVAGIGNFDSTYNDFTIVRLNSGGSMDNSFGTNGIVHTDIQFQSDDYAMGMCIQPDGKIVVGGRSAAYLVAYDFAMVRYESNGDIDSSFGVNGIVTTDIAGFNDYGSDMKLQADGKIVLAGYSYDGVGTSMAIARYNTNGSLDTSFDVDGIAITPIPKLYLDGQSVCIQPDGKIIAVGTLLMPGNNYDEVMIRYNQNGDLDTTMNHTGIKITDVCYTDYCYAVALQQDGKILMAGSSIDTVGGMLGTGFSLVRHLANGSLDTTFDTDGKVIMKVSNIADRAFAIAVNSNGKILVAGHSFDGVSIFNLVVIAYMQDGSLDSTFGIDGVVKSNMASEHEYTESIAIQSDGKIVTTGFFRDGGTFDMYVARYTGESPMELAVQPSAATLTISPNPFRGQTVIHSSLTMQDASIELYNLYGQKVRSINHLKGNTFTCYQNELACGMYLIELREKKNVVAREKIIVSE